ncbi:hypothetical protein EW026_g1010 [Hermanssonia centrifuga]|uniref:Uncharacterized protein n=1 Tax=Hermanssonia centrifuga TaxID=98765 RepID=A0A4V3XBF9_9APHY|nr:hypothetical protein EW026_g1010 [Hermanssonia centrifuga]
MRHSAFNQRSRISTAPLLDKSYTPPPQYINVQPAAPKETTLSLADYGQLTAGQLSRASAQAIRAYAGPAPITGLFLLNSILYSSAPKTERDLSGPALFNEDSPEETHPYTPIDYGKPVPLRLSAHSFLHTLLRAGHRYKASIFAEQMMEAGVRIRSTTLEAIVDSLCGDTSVSIISDLRSGVKYDKDVLDLRLEHFAHSGNRAAYSILVRAKKYQQYRSQRLYDRVINACLLQGELIVGSLLFVLLVKDWEVSQARKALAQESNGADSDSADPTQARPDQGYPTNSKGDYGWPDERNLGQVSDRWMRKARNREPVEGLTPYPSAELLGKITRSIEDAMSQDPQSPDDEAYLQEALQALGNLVLLVEEGHIHFGKLSPLFKTLYNCPKTQHRIWKRKDGIPTQVKAYRYFHGFLGNLMGSFKDGMSPNIPPLDTRSYNSLLHYALRHRLSPAHASDILEHMCVRRKPPLKPPIETYNILIRSGTLLRRLDISDMALDVLRRENSSQHHGIMVIPSPREKAKPTTAIHAGRIPGNRQFTKALDRLRKQGFNLPDTVQHPGTLITTDAYTLSSYIMYLASTGDLHLVDTLLFRVLPELHVIDHPSWGNLPEEQRPAQARLNHRRCVERAVDLGPHFFAIVLNALAKAGKTGLAERIWMLGMQAQRASWVLSQVSGTNPWCLSIHAYTSMLECYANEARKGVARSDVGDLDSNWRPQRPNAHVRGWARSAYRRGQLKGVSRHQAGERLGMQLFRSMFSGGEAVMEALQGLESDVKEAEELGLELPIPDARFYNAALRLFGYQPGMKARSIRPTRAHCRRFLIWADDSYFRHGAKFPHWTRNIQAVAEAMLESRFPVPAGFRHLFIGRWEPGMMYGEALPTLNRSPYAYPSAQRRTFHRHRFRTTKTRGLPIRRVAPVKSRPRRQSK